MKMAEYIAHSNWYSALFICKIAIVATMKNNTHRQISRVLHTMYRKEQSSFFLLDDKDRAFRMVGTVVAHTAKEKPLYWPTAVASQDEQIDIQLLCSFAYGFLGFTHLDDGLCIYPVVGADGLGLIDQRLSELPLVLGHRPDELRGHNRRAKRGAGGGGDVAEGGVGLDGEEDEAAGREVPQGPLERVLAALAVVDRHHHLLLRRCRRHDRAA